MQAVPENGKSTTGLDRPLSSYLKINWEIAIFLLIVLVAVVTRFYDLGARVMSHDESLHTYFSWKLFKEGSFQHSPLMHGPLQFHLLALTYFFLGDSDFTARIPAALCSIATVAFLWRYRRYLGRSGALITAGLFTISPFMLYYGRYVRNEAFVALFGLVSLWAVLRYLDTGEHRFLYWLTAATSLHFAAKETSFIYTAQLLLFLGFYFLREITQLEWKLEDRKKLFMILMIAALALLALSLSADYLVNLASPPDPTEVSAPALPDNPDGKVSGIHQFSTLMLAFGGAGLLALLAAVVVLVIGYGLNQLREIRSFGLIVLLGSLVFPMLAAFPVRLAGWDPMNYSSNESLSHTALFLVPMIVLSVVAGLWWNRREWSINLLIFYVIYIPLFTTFFTNGEGFFTGLVGSLGYWLEQQGVKRGSQPWYYYLALQIPVYEYLAAAGTLLAAGIGLRHLWPSQNKPTEEGETTAPLFQPGQGRALALFGFWVLSSATAYTIAGERMPWLTVHIALPMLLLSGWALGHLVDKVNWQDFVVKRGWGLVGLLAIALTVLAAAMFGSQPAGETLAGKNLLYLQSTYRWLFTVLVLAACIWALLRLLRGWDLRQFWLVLALLLFSSLGLLTVRTATMAAFIDYDQATEYLVYAHSAGGVKDIMARVEDISRRTTDGLGLQVAFDDDVSWPFTWYLRNYPNQKYYANNPTRELRNAPVILVGDNNYNKLEPVVASGYYSMETIRMWWPNQDYFGLSSQQVRDYITDQAMRGGLFDIWFKRDYSAYAEATNQVINLASWSPSDRMRMYVRKDVAASLWDYGVGSGEETLVIDPYEGKEMALSADQIIYEVDGEALFNAPRGLAYSPDGSLYLADSKNHRILKLEDGQVVDRWGEFQMVPDDETGEGGGFNEPWGVAVSPDGNYVFVADTWNHRIQKFTKTGRFVSQWGSFGQSSSDPYLLYGPRALTIDAQGNLLLTDTGNKRVLVYNQDGDYLSQFGGTGYGAGKFDEPVGITADPASGKVFVADTWNQRIQVFEPDESGAYQPVDEWEINGWYGNSLENKPYLTVGDDGNLYITDPELGRALVYTQQGEFLHYFGDVGDSYSVIGLASGIAPDGHGGIWLSDGSHNQLYHYTLPE